MTAQTSYKRAIGVGLVLGILLGFSAFASIRCGDNNGPTGPTEISSDIPTQENLSPTPAPANPPSVNSPTAPSDTNAKERFNPVFHSQTGTFDVTIEHLAGTLNKGQIGVACYENPHQTDGARQIYHRSQTGNINDADKRRISAKIPECTYWQCDGFEGAAITGAAGEEIDVFYGRRLIFGRSGGPQGDCSPPPQCEGDDCEPPSCEDSLRVETQIRGDVGWVFLKNLQGQIVGEVHRELTLEPQSGEVCVGQGEETLRALTTDETCCLPWKLPPREQRCEEDPPVPSGTTTGSVSITESNGRWDADVTVNYAVSGAPGEYLIELVWRNGNSSRTKKEQVVRIACDGSTRGSFDWDSHNHDCEHSHVNPNARYYQKISYRATPQASWSTVEPETLIGQGASVCEEVCEPPNETSFQRERSIGNPTAECSFFGDYVPTDRDGADFYLTKCGLFYQLTHNPFVGNQCSNGQDKSHTTACVCASDN